MPTEVFHPMVVHFPIALLLVAFLVETLALVFKIAAWHRIAFWNLVLGTWGALVAVITGGLAAAAVQPTSTESRGVLDLHGVWGTMAFVLAVTVNGWHLAAGKQMSRRARWVAWGLLGITCGVMALASHLGGRLVYQYQVVEEVSLP